MKFNELAIGLRFLYQDHEFTKVSPLMAKPEGESANRLIPRSATVTPLDEPDSQPQAPREIAVDELNRAMQRLTDEINDILIDSGLEAATLNQLSKELQRAFQRARLSLHL